MKFLSAVAAKLLRDLGFKQAGWNISHASGAWDAKQRSQDLVALVERLAAGGRVVEFGCGNGEVVGYLPDGAFSSYLGTDVSSVAVKTCAETHKRANVSFEVADMASWPGENGGVQLILCEECIYYLTPDQVESFLNICMSSLTDTGRVLLTLHSKTKFAGLIAQIRAGWNVVEDKDQGDRVYLVLGKPA